MLVPDNPLPHLLPEAGGVASVLLLLLVPADPAAAGAASVLMPSAAAWSGGIGAAAGLVAPPETGPCAAWRCDKSARSLSLALCVQRRHSSVLTPWDFALPHYERLYN